MDQPGNVWRHAPRTKPFDFAVGDPALIDAVSSHVERWVGPIDLVLHEILSDLVHVDVHLVRPQPGRAFNTLVTSGMSERPMTTPPDAEQFAYAELVLNLPPDWPVADESWEDEANYWPVRMLEALARMPHEYDTWLGYGHTVSADPDGGSYHPSTKFTGALIAPVLMLPGDLAQLELEDRTIFFWSVVPLYAEELAYKLEHGTDALLDKLGEAGVTDILDPARQNACKRSRFRFWR